MSDEENKGIRELKEILTFGKALAEEQERKRREMPELPKGWLEYEYIGRPNFCGGARMWREDGSTYRTDCDSQAPKGESQCFFCKRREGDERARRTQAANQARKDPKDHFR